MLCRKTIAVGCENLTKHEHILWTKWRLELRWRRNTNCDDFLAKSIEVHEIWMHEACQSLARLTRKPGLKIYFFVVISQSLGTVGNHRPLCFHFESIDRRASSEMCCTPESLSHRISAATYADCENFYLLTHLEACVRTLPETVHDSIVP